jgi:hypothetical protein
LKPFIVYGVRGAHPLDTEKNSEEFFAASPSGEPMVPEENLRLEKNASAFFGMREGVTIVNLKNLWRQIGFYPAATE